MVNLYDTRGIFHLHFWPSLGGAIVSAVTWASLG